jgi:hypothetical protein
MAGIWPALTHARKGIKMLTLPNTRMVYVKIAGSGQLRHGEQYANNLS